LLFLNIGVEYNTSILQFCVVNLLVSKWSSCGFTVSSHKKRFSGTAISFIFCWVTKVWAQLFLYWNRM